MSSARPSVLGGSGRRPFGLGGPRPRSQSRDCVPYMRRRERDTSGWKAEIALGPGMPGRIGQRDTRGTGFVTGGVTLRA